MIKAPTSAAAATNSAWLGLFRRLKISYERLTSTRKAFLGIACALIVWRATHPVARAEAAY